MTSQVVLMNSIGAAIASDSVVTIGGEQTFANVNKIYGIGEGHKIEVMISGSANYIPGNIPWERVIELWKDRFHQIDCDYFDEYVSDFRDFLKGDKQINVKNQNGIRLQYDLRQFIKSIPPMEGILHAGDTFETLDGRPWTKDVNFKNMHGRLQTACYTDLQEFNNYLESIIEDIKQEKDNYENFQKECAELKKYEENNISLVATYFAREARIFEEEIIALDELEQLFIKILTNHVCICVEKGIDISPNSRTMITIVGFGNKDIRPKMIELSCGWDPKGSRRTARNTSDTTKLTESFHIRQHENVTDNGRLKVYCEHCFKENICVEIEGKECEKCNQKQTQTLQSASAFVRGIAMKTEIDTILNGMRKESFPTLSDPNFTNYLSNALIEGILTDLKKIEGIGKVTNEKLIKVFNEEIYGKVNSTIVKFHQTGVFHSWVQRRQEYRRIISLLPIQEMARFAKHLVNHEAEICRLMDPVRSVGGKISVATITKEKGLIFIEND